MEELAQEFQGFEPPLFPVVERKVVAEADGKRLELLWVQVDKARHAPVSFRSDGELSRAVVGRCQTMIHNQLSRKWSLQ